MRATTRRAAALDLVVAGAVMFAVIATGCSDTPSAAPPVDASTTTTEVSTTTSLVPPTTAGVVIVTVAGKITKILPNGDLALNDGRSDYTIAMASSPKIVDVNGTEVTGDAVKVGEAVQITGTIGGKTITAQTMIVPVNPPSVSTTSSG